MQEASMTFFTLVILTPAEVKSLSGMAHRVQVPVAAAAGSGWLPPGYRWLDGQWRP